MRKTYFLISIPLLLFSCKKEEPINNLVLNPASSFTLAKNVGSYWVYEWYDIDSSGNETVMGITDSVYVVGDTVINAKTYVHYSGTYMGNATVNIIRDSSGFIVSSNGNIVFSRINFTDTTSYSENMWANMKTYSFTRKPSQSVTTVAGSFNVYDKQSHYYSLDATPFTNCDSSWVQHYKYDDISGIEILSQTAFISQLQSNCRYMERRLVRFYHAP